MGEGQIDRGMPSPLVSRDPASPPRGYELNLLWSRSTDRLPLESRLAPQHKVAARVVGPREQALGAVLISLQGGCPSTMAPGRLLNARACCHEVPACLTPLVGHHRLSVSHERAMARCVLPYWNLPEDDRTLQFVLPTERALVGEPMWMEKSTKCRIFRRPSIPTARAGAVRALFLGNPP